MVTVHPLQASACFRTRVKVFSSRFHSSVYTWTRSVLSVPSVSCSLYLWHPSNSTLHYREGKPTSLNHQSTWKKRIPYWTSCSFGLASLNILLLMKLCRYDDCWLTNRTFPCTLAAFWIKTLQCKIFSRALIAHPVWIYYSIIVLYCLLFLLKGITIMLSLLVRMFCFAAWCCHVIHSIWSFLHFFYGDFLHFRLELDILIFCCPF